jgi:acylpyruvate hydrolase
MRLLTYTLPPEHIEDRIGLSVMIGGVEFIIDASSALNAYYEADGDAPSPGADRISMDSFRGDMRALLAGGPEASQAAASVEVYAKAQLASEERQAIWLRNKIAHRVEEIHWRPPIPRPGKIIMIGGNYKAHRAERGKASDQLPAALLDEPPAVPPAFAKFSSTLVGHDASIIYPSNSAQLDYETELCVVIGKRCKDVPADQFADVVAGYVIGNDVSMRDLQFAEMRRGSTMFGKNLDTAMPMGPYLVTPDEVGDPQNLRITCWVNGELRQRGSTQDMTCSIGNLIHHYSRITLEPGDIIATGTPAGVGIFWDPPEHGLLRVGDVIEMSIEHLGRLRNVVVAENEDVANDPRKRAR